MWIDKKSGDISIKPGNEISLHFHLEKVMKFDFGFVLSLGTC